MIVVTLQDEPKLKRHRQIIIIGSMHMPDDARPRKPSIHRCYKSPTSSCADAHSSSEPLLALLSSPSISAPPTSSSFLSFFSPCPCLFACPSAPCSSSNFTVSSPRGRYLAAINAVLKCPPFAFTFAPCSSSSRTMASWPSSDAACSAFP
ncbi:hypothetical protein FIBSPDRAFT_273376 [Athelia psychrophila]|uniref:Uncharacterized protein n=1 Tax=Athelia psychrophila TaxID=1759441 RepID=A0A165WS93_9AGAM|nr:hypothetical protein FIBSPDRAFT_273376 [Fibularhizoctonia sp. CBS 109695]